MQKQSKIPNPNANFTERKTKVKEARRDLRESLMSQAIRHVVGSVSDRLSPYSSIPEELFARQNAVANQIQTYRSQLEKLLKDFNKIPDPRRLKSIKHKLTTLLLYGLLSCLFQMTSRREANQDMSKPAFWTALQGLFPELESMPHADTLARLLTRIDPIEIENTHINLLNCYIRNKKFCRYLINNCYPIAVDGTQKLVRNGDLWEEEWLRRKVGKIDDKKVQRYVYVLEVNFVFHNGLTLPIMSEFLFFEDNRDETKSHEKIKQDCELKAFKRVAKRLKQYFKRLPFIIMFDGLYSNGPLMTLCKENNWEYMIVLQDKSLPSVWEEVESLEKIQKNKTIHRIWKGRQQLFHWVNHIEYCYGNHGDSIPVHVVICEETWKEVNAETGEIEEKNSRHVWISSVPLNRHNIHKRCNLGARYRWAIENSMNTEKNRGYCYEHPFSYDWNAMRGFHYLMRMAHMLNALAQHTKEGAKLVKEMGIRSLLKFVRETFTGLWITSEWCYELLGKPFQLRLE